MAAQNSGNRLSTLYPSHVSHWLPMLEDISNSTAFKKKMSTMTANLQQNEEWRYISMDATFKVCLKILGQATYRASANVRNEAPFPDDVAWRRLLTIRGRSGAVLLLKPLPSESSEHLAEALRDSFTATQLSSIFYIATDSPSVKFFKQAQEICPHLQAMTLDPIHLAIVYEYGFWNKKSAGSKTILAKTSAVDESVQSNCWLEFYDGDMSRPLTAIEERYRRMILEQSMTAKEADKFLSIDGEKPFYSRLEFIQCIAALCKRFEHEVVRKAAGPNKEIFKILWSACAPDRLEWLFNNIRLRHTLSREHLRFLPSGTASNESLHAEINSWTRSTNALHRSTLSLKLRYYLYIKRLSHYLATCFPLSHVTTETMLLARSLRNSLWSPEEWQTWCSCQNSEGKRRKASLPLVDAFLKEKAMVKNWVLKKPSAKPSKSRKQKKLTPLSVPRTHTLVTAGVKRKQK